MSMKISVILLFLLYIGILIFAEKITDHHHAYNRRSEITHMNLVTCTAKVWRSISSSNGIISIFTCRILETLRSIFPQKKLSNQFLVYEEEWNIMKIKYIGKCELEILFFLPQLLISWIYAVGLKLLNLGEVFLWGILFYIVCVGGRLVGVMCIGKDK